MKTTTQITQEHKAFLTSVNEMPMNKYLEKANVKWYSEDKILDAIKKVQNSNKLFNDFETDFLNILFNTPDLNSRSFNKDSFNKG
jgi:hypothetical protein